MFGIYMTWRDVLKNYKQLFERRIHLILFRYGAEGGRDSAEADRDLR